MSMPRIAKVQRGSNFYTMVAFMAIFLGVRIAYHVVTGHELEQTPNTVLGLSLVLAFTVLRIRELRQTAPRPTDSDVRRR